MGGEILAALEWLAEQRPGSTRIAGLRDIWDSPENVARTWERQRIDSVLEELYTHIVVYGAPAIYDATREYGFSEALRAKTTFCGFVGRWRPGEEAAREPREPGARPLVVVTIGGGDGAGEEVLGSWMAMLRARRERVDFDSLLLTGPFIEPELAERLRREAEGLPVEVQGFVPSTRRFLERSDLVVCTGGYNTMVEVASFAGRALVLPRCLHREEQTIRARVFAEHGLVSTLDAAQADPERLYSVVRGLLDDPARPLARARGEGRLPLDGAQGFAEFCSRLEVTA
jgi:predicted glycosyltransferase